MQYTVLVLTMMSHNIIVINTQILSTKMVPACDEAYHGILSQTLDA